MTDVTREEVRSSSDFYENFSNETLGLYEPELKKESVLFKAYLVKTTDKFTIRIRQKLYYTKGTKGSYVKWVDIFSVSAKISSTEYRKNVPSLNVYVKQQQVPLFNITGIRSAHYVFNLPEELRRIFIDELEELCAKNSFKVPCDFSQWREDNKKSLSSLIKFLAFPLRNHLDEYHERDFIDTSVRNISRLRNIEQVSDEYDLQNKPLTREFLSHVYDNNLLTDKMLHSLVILYKALNDDDLLYVIRSAQTYTRGYSHQDVATLRSIISRVDTDVLVDAFSKKLVPYISHNTIERFRSHSKAIRRSKRKLVSLTNNDIDALIDSVLDDEPQKSLAIELNEKFSHFVTSDESGISYLGTLIITYYRNRSEIVLRDLPLFHANKELLHKVTNITTKKNLRAQVLDITRNNVPKLFTLLHNDMLNQAKKVKQELNEKFMAHYCYYLRANRLKTIRPVEFKKFIFLRENGLTEEQAFKLAKDRVSYKTVETYIKMPSSWVNKLLNLDTK